MRIIILIFLISIVILEAKKIDRVTVEEIVSTYADYRLKRDRRFEENILKPRFENFTDFLYLGVLELKDTNKSDTLAYCAVLSLLSKKKRSIILPTKYEKLKVKIKREIRLILDSNQSTISPILAIKVNYKKFRVPKWYKNSQEYYRSMKYIQTVPLLKNHTKVKTDKKIFNKLLRTITLSERLVNLQRELNSSIDRFISIKSDFKIMRTLVNSNYIKEFELYFKKSKVRISLYGNRVFSIKNIKKSKTNIAKIFKIMINDILKFTHSNYKNENDIKILKWINRLKKNHSKIK